MEFVVIFLVTLLIIGGLGLAIFFGKPPTHRPSRKEILDLLRRLEVGEARREEWDMFLGYPLHYDPPLENLRQRCLILEEGDADTPPVMPGLGSNIYGKEGRAQVHILANALEQLIDEEPQIREF